MIHDTNCANIQLHEDFRADKDVHTRKITWITILNASFRLSFSSCMVLKAG